MSTQQAFAIKVHAGLIAGLVLWLVSAAPGGSGCGRLCTQNAGYLIGINREKTDRQRLYCNGDLAFVTQEIAPRTPRELELRDLF